MPSVRIDSFIRAITAVSMRPSLSASAMIVETVPPCWERVLVCSLAARAMKYSLTAPISGVRSSLSKRRARSLSRSTGVRGQKA